MVVSNHLQTKRRVRRRATHEDRQQQIVETARKIITDQGMEHLTMDTLAEGIGLSEAAIYRHMDGKQQILRLVLEDIERGLLELVEQGRKEGASSLDKLKNILKAHLSYSERRRGVSFLVLNEVLRLDDRKLRKFAGSVVERYLNAIKGVLTRGLKKGEVRQDLDLDMATRLFFGMVQSNVTLWALQSHSFPLAERYESLWDLYHRAICVPS